MSGASTLPPVPDAQGTPIDRSYFFTEGCAAFALVLARRLHAQGHHAGIAVLARRDGQPWSDNHAFEFSHAVVSAPEGYVDVMGLHPEFFEIARRIGIASSVDDIFLKGPWRVEEFERRFVGFDDDKPLFPGDEQIHDWATRLIDADPARFGLTPTSINQRHMNQEFTQAVAELADANAQFLAGLLNPVSHGDRREEALAHALDAMAKGFGVTLEKPLHIDGNGEFSIVAMPPDGSSPKLGTGPFGKEFVTELNQHWPRTGTQPGAVLLPEVGWCRMHHDEVEKMVVRYHDEQLRAQHAQQARDAIDQAAKPRPSGLQP